MSRIQNDELHTEKIVYETYFGEMEISDEEKNLSRFLFLFFMLSWNLERMKIISYKVFLRNIGRWR